ncbi:hypothetical protein C0995_013456 [Termitomyces sp. Mi166|nr:hypothetical protein C0995_013456 [Termitomyces sp. Mi166\
MTPEQAKEEEAVVMLAGIMSVDNDQARRVLRKYKGDVEKAADAILSGDQGDEPSSLWPPSTESSQDPGYGNPFTDATHAAAQSSSSNVIDLTGDDNDRALKLSQAQSDIKFGPSERAPDPAWQMVTSNTPVDTGNDDRAMNEAIQASLADFGSSEELEILPMEESVREGGRLTSGSQRPVALRTDAVEIAYAALIIQAFAQIPQIRRNIATLLERVDETPPRFVRYPDVVELFVNLDLAQLSAILDKDVLPFMNPVPWDGTNASLGYGSADFIKRFAADVDTQINVEVPSNEPPIRLFQFSHAKAESRGRSIKVHQNTEQTSCVVEIHTGDSATPNDLISRLSSSLHAYNEFTQTTTHDVIVHPSEVVAFHLRPMQSTGQGKTVEPFAFPRQFPLDRFILDNLSLTEEKEAQERKMRDEINDLTKRRELLTRGDVSPVSLAWYDHSTIDVAVEKLQAELAAVYEVPELQKHLYDLRAVFMHTGLPGRKQIYSYIRDGHGVWWKTVDHTVTEVPEETALTDPTGLHLGAGPYLLLYNRHLSEEELLAPVAWPESIADSVEDHNKKLFAMLKPEGEEKAGVQKAGVPLAAAPTVSMSSLSSAAFGDREATQILEDVEMQTQLD